MHQAESAPTAIFAIAALAIALATAWIVLRDAPPRRSVQRTHAVHFDHDVLTLPQVDTSHVEVFQLR